MSKRAKGRLPTSKEASYVLLLKSCVNAMCSHKLSSHDAYIAEIEALGMLCDHLITHHGQNIDELIFKMEQKMLSVHDRDIEEIDKKIKRLFNMRKQTPCNSSYCEQEVLKLSTEIRLLEEQKKVPINDIIQDIIHDALEYAIKTLGTDPGDYNLSRNPGM